MSASDNKPQNTVELPVDHIDDLIATHTPKDDIVMEVMREIYARLPYDQEIVLANGRKGRVTKFVEPKIEDDVHRFSFDFKFDDGGYIEFRAEKTGWGSPILAPMPDEAGHEQ